VTPGCRGGALVSGAAVGHAEEQASEVECLRRHVNGVDECRRRALEWGGAPAGERAQAGRRGQACTGARVPTSSGRRQWWASSPADANGRRHRQGGRCDADLSWGGVGPGLGTCKGVNCHLLQTDGR
jgi:hypothetical protein